MKNNEARSVVKGALKAISTGEGLDEYFDDDASFNTPRNPYRIDDLGTFARANESFFGVGGRIVNFDLRQPRVVDLDGATVVSFYYAQRVELGGASMGSNGRGSAVINGGGKIVLLHLTENDGPRGVLPLEGFAATDVLGAAERGGVTSLLAGAMWGCE